LEDDMVWVSKDNLEAEGPDSSDFGPVSKGLIRGCAVRIGDAGNTIVRNSAETTRGEMGYGWLTLPEVEEVVRGFKNYATTSASLSPESEQALKDSVGLFDAREKKKLGTMVRELKKMSTLESENTPVNTDGRKTKESQASASCGNANDESSQRPTDDTALTKESIDKDEAGHIERTPPENGQRKPEEK